MSHQVNTDIMERAYELAEECTNSSIGAQLLAELNTTKDLERLQELSRIAENELRRDEWPEVGEEY